MNIFVLNSEPYIAAREMCDKHVVKMIVESAQMLSTCHRVLDGSLEKRDSVSGKRKIDYYKLSDSRESILYKAAHLKHPCNIWIRESNANYKWLYDHFLALLSEYKWRYNKNHACGKLVDVLASTPINIPESRLTTFPQAMPDDCKGADAVQAYQTYYIKYKKDFATWKHRAVPSWFQAAC